MPVLAYCITEAEPEIVVPQAGVGKAEIRSLHEAGLRCFVSDYSNQVPVKGKSAPEPALAFGRVLHEIFRQVAVIPFCFPTILADEGEIAAFVREHAAEYRENLARLRHSVQIEIQISHQSRAQQGGLRDQTGKDYLRKRQMRHHELAAALQEFRQAGQEWTEDWREREVAGGIRGYALVPRASVQAFLQKMENLPVTTGLQARVSGPWPATQFLKEK